MKLTYDAALVNVVARGNGFDVTAVGTDAVSTVVTAKVGALSTQLTVTAGLSSEVVDEVDDTTRWQANAVPAGAATASRSVAEGHDGGQAIALDYSLTGSTATRAAYLSQTPQQTLPGQPQKLGAWVYGDGKGAWLRANAYDGAGGAAQTLNLAAAVDWTGWKYVEADIPAGLAMPLRFWRIYVVETVPTRQYSGRIIIDDLTVRGAPPVTVTPPAKVIDPMVVTDGTATGGGRWKFAVMSDAQFTADDPESDFVKQARRTIREALAQQPDFLVINGDFVDRGFAQDIALAKKIIDEEVGRQGAGALRAGQPRELRAGRPVRVDQGVRRSDAARSTTRELGSSCATRRSARCGRVGSRRSSTCASSWTTRRGTRRSAMSW